MKVEINLIVLYCIVTNRSARNVNSKHGARGSSSSLNQGSADHMAGAGSIPGRDTSFFLVIII